MPWKVVDIEAEIQKKRVDNPEFREAWDSSREEYRILGEVARLRKEKGLSQSALADEMGVKQQVISRIEKRENSPSLRMLCSLLSAMDYQIEIIPKKQPTT